MRPPLLDPLRAECRLRAIDEKLNQRKLSTHGVERAANGAAATLVEFLPEDSYRHTSPASGALSLRTMKDGTERKLASAPARRRRLFSAPPAPPTVQVDPMLTEEGQRLMSERRLWVRIRQANLSRLMAQRLSQGKAVPPPSRASTDELVADMTSPVQNRTMLSHGILRGLSMGDMGSPRDIASGRPSTHGPTLTARPKLASRGGLSSPRMNMGPATPPPRSAPETLPFRLVGGRLVAAPRQNGEWRSGLHALFHEIDHNTNGSLAKAEFVAMCVRARARACACACHVCG